MSPLNLGKLTIPWLILMVCTISYSFANFFIYILSLLFINTQYVYTLNIPFIYDSDDLAAAICYIPIFTVDMIVIVGLIQKYRKSWTVLSPQPKDVLKSSALAAFLTIPFWCLFGWFFNSYKVHLPGDGNWAAIACFTSIASIFLMLIVIIIPIKE